MPTEVKLPELGENLEGGEVVEVSVKAGDTVSEGQTLLEIEAEKSTVEVPAPVAGRVAKLLVQKGDKVAVGQAICLIEVATAEKDGVSESASVRARADQLPAAQHGSMAARDGIREREKKASQVAAEILPSTGPPREQEIAGDGEEERSGERGAAPPGAPTTRKPHKLVPAGPATRRLARELGVDLSQVSGSARGGRVIPDDVKAYVRQLASQPEARAAGIQPPPLPDFERWGPVERQPLEPVRRRTAAQMSLASSLIPHVTQHDQADVTDLDAFRRQQEASGPKLTITAFALKAAASALKQFPQLNSSLDLASGQLILKHYYHIGVAVDTDRGLLVPVLRDVDKKSVRELARELTEVAERARQKKLAVEEMRGGTFTITNLGGIGGTGFSPIVNYPEVAILGLSRARLQPVVRSGEIVPRLVLPLSLSYDHRVIDGALAARFAHRITEMLENPLQMLL
jgi:pyruvate dehydrogenase E2 component (dihydrolipoamide acetyltransferase)